MPILPKIHWKVKKILNQIWIKNSEIFKLFLEINYEDLSVELILEKSVQSHMHFMCMIEEL